jgi:soluble lytic murein transglycosylase
MSNRISDDKKLTLKYISSKPASRSKNFLIWQYLQLDITPQEAQEAYKQVLGNNNKIYKLYIKKTTDKKILYTENCRKKTDILAIKDYTCFKSAYSIDKALKLSKPQRKILLKKLKKAKSKEILKILDEPYRSSSYKNYSVDVVLSFFNKSYTFRRKYLNIMLDKKLINSLTKSWRINKFINVVVNDDKVDNLQKSLLLIDAKNLNSQSNFFLAINHLRYNQTKKAIHFFKLSYKNAKRQIDLDKNVFWLYYVTKKEKYIKRLLKSKDINIYTIYANELRGKKQNNYFTKVKTDLLDFAKPIVDPFKWELLRKKIKDISNQDKLFLLAESYSQKSMIPIKTFILEKAYRYKVHGFIMPYNKYMTNVTKDKKALIYALMKQESNFIPASLSRSFALGLMQLMPFLVDIIKKQLNDDSTYNDMFIPQNNIKYAIKHINWMEKTLFHPLFIAYAYNGGMGYLKRHLISTKRFQKGKYEPFLSMELMANTETREYGKKVLANYVIYKRILGDEILLTTLLDRLTDPKSTDHFGR